MEVFFLSPREFSVTSFLELLKFSIKVKEKYFWNDRGSRILEYSTTTTDTQTRARWKRFITTFLSPLVYLDVKLFSSSSNHWDWIHFYFIQPKSNICFRWIVKVVLRVKVTRVSHDLSTLTFQFCFIISCDSCFMSFNRGAPTEPRSWPIFSL